MNKGLVVTLAGAIIGCIGLGYIIGSRENLVVDDLSVEAGEDPIEKSANIVKRVIEEVRDYMNNKTNAVIETLSFCKDVLSDKSCRLTLGCAAIGVGVALVASVYIPTPV